MLTRAISSASADFYYDTVSHAVTGFITAQEVLLLRFGTGTTPVSFTDRRLASEVEAIAPYITIDRVGNAYEVRMYATPSVNATEIGISQRIRWQDFTLTREGHVYFTRALASLPAGQGVRYSVRFNHPFNVNLARLFYGFFNRTSVPMTDVSGSTYSIDCIDITAVEPGSLIITGESTVDDVDLVVPPSYTVLPTTWNAVLTSTTATIRGYSAFSPSTQVVIRGIGLVKRVRDTGGTARTVLLMMKNLDPPVTVEPGTVRTVEIRVYGRA